MNSNAMKRVCNESNGWVVCVLAVACLMGMYPAGAEDPVFDWAAGISGNQPMHGNGVAVDASGNVYMTGFFENTVDFDPGPGTFNVTEVDEAIKSIFIVKLDTLGNVVWANSKGGTNEPDEPNLTVDASGNVYSTGAFEGTVDFDPGSGVFELTADDSGPVDPVHADFTGGDIFVQKLDAAGNFMWAKAMGGTLRDMGSDIAVDDSGNVYIAGRFFHETVDFDPGPGVFNITSAGAWDIFVCKLDPAGDFVWASVMGGPSIESPPSLALDALGNAYTTGRHSEDADFDPGPGNFNFPSLGSPGSHGVFVSKLDSAGNFAWAKTFSGGQKEVGTGIAVDALGNVYTVGNFDNTVDFDPGPGTFNLTSNFNPNGSDTDFFVSKLDTLGNFVWAKAMGGTRIDHSLGVAVDGSGNVYTTGEFSGTVDFDPGEGTFNLMTSGGSSNDNAFVSKLDSSGNFMWAGSMSEGSSNGSRGNGIALDASGDVYIRGAFSNMSDFNPGPGTFTLDNEASGVFLVKLRQGTSLSRIVSNPPSGFVEPGGSVTLMLTGDPLGPFQWFKDNAPMVDDPPRATGTNGSVLTFNPVELGDSGTYHVTYDNGAKVPAQSPTFELDVVPNVPLLGVFGLAMLAVMLMVAGYAITRRYSSLSGTKV